MILTLSIGENNYKTRLDAGIDISLSFGPDGDNPNAFHISTPEIAPIVVGDFVGSVKQGSGANCDVIRFCAHGNTTHIECVGHISIEHQSVGDCINEFIMLADVISVPLQFSENKSFISADISSMLPSQHSPAIVIRTLPNNADKKSRVWSGANPPFFSVELMEILKEKGYRHLLTDLPSVDPEEDNGELAAHHIWWNYPINPRMNASITELIYVPNEVVDGRYILMLQFPKIQSDASPCRPMLYPIISEL